MATILAMGRYLTLGCTFWLMAALTTAMAADPPRPGVPTGKGLPVQIKVGVAFLSIESFSENSGSFKATIDLRARWTDIRLRRPAAEANDPPRVLRGAAAQAQLDELWVPKVDVINQRGEPSYTALGLRIYPDGQVEIHAGSRLSSRHRRRRPLSFDHPRICGSSWRCATRRPIRGAGIRAGRSRFQPPFPQR